MIRNMDNEINEWLEHEYSAFERQFFSHCRVWRLPVHVLKGTDLYRLFETFSRTFPDHPSDVNTVFYLIEPTKPDSVMSSPPSAISRPHPLCVRRSVTSSNGWSIPFVSGGRKVPISKMRAGSGRWAKAEMQSRVEASLH